ncbi:hypothetical protein FUT88_12425 [Ralstonia sp. TCR112]|uniref:hypothetical protein n=1 Tax=Ralstonia sp. TCR112 TaxID=2601730 RepID=UPI0011BF7BF7|nr:hypothetical protein [Ralstonia sp. TCR112]TXD59925.1 hypothetical protein FUT88_12425 [Ralstonia sp. TCR112]
MATGDQQDIFARIRGYLPRWFGDAAQSPIINGLLQGLAYSGAYVYSLYAYAKQQTRILTASDGWLDMIAADFFGLSIKRRAGQSDASFRANIVANLFRERGTRNAIIRVLTDLTGRTPSIIEPSRPADCGAYDAPNSGYCMAGAYGQVSLTYQAFVQAYRPLGSGIPNVAGYSIVTTGYSAQSQGEYVDASMSSNTVSDADIYAAIESVRPAASIIWTRISS